MLAKKLQGAGGTAAVFWSNPEATLGSPTYTMAANTTASVGSALSGDFVVAIDITIETGTIGMIWEAGGATRGAGIAFDGTNIRTGAFYSGSNWEGTNYACLTVDFTDYLDTFGTFYFTGDFSGGSTNLYWMEGGPDSGKEAVFLGQATGGGNGDIWGTDSSGFIAITASVQDFGFTGDTSAYNGTTVDAEARIWRNVSEPVPLQTS